MRVTRALAEGRGRRGALALAGWLSAAAAATLVGLAAINVIGDGITDPTGEVISEARLAQDLAAPTSTSPAPLTTSSSPSPLRSAADPSPGSGVGVGVGAGAGANGGMAARALSTPGGTAVSRCDGDQVTLTTITPAQGYAVQRSERGPAREAEVRFTGSAGDVEMRIECGDGQPVMTWKLDDHDDD
ncbi:hypothetical protein UG55_103585 [Frankia sp. EI5c]|nr:hypothetical protein UG55_103585 [Frankia sp. EI5c]